MPNKKEPEDELIENLGLNDELLQNIPVKTKSDIVFG